MVAAGPFERLTCDDVGQKIGAPSEAVGVDVGVVVVAVAVAVESCGISSARA